MSSPTLATSVAEKENVGFCANATPEKLPFLYSSYEPNPRWATRLLPLRSPSRHLIPSHAPFTTNHTSKLRPTVGSSFSSMLRDAQSEARAEADQRLARDIAKKEQLEEQRSRKALRDLATADARIASELADAPARAQRQREADDQAKLRR